MVQIKLINHFPVLAVGGAGGATQAWNLHWSSSQGGHQAIHPPEGHRPGRSSQGEEPAVCHG